jgi:hypothetical protein
MKRQLVPYFSVALIVLVCVTAMPAQQAVTFDGKLSVNVDDMAVGRVLELLDQATGLQSTIPADLAGRKTSVHFSALPINEAVRRILERLDFDYVYIEANGIVVTGLSKPGPVPPGLPAFETTEPPIQEPAEAGALQPPETTAEPPIQPPPPVYTPFGWIPDSGNPFVQLPPIPGVVWRPFFIPYTPAPPPGPAQTDLFRPISVYGGPNSTPGR